MNFNSNDEFLNIATKLSFDTNQEIQETEINPALEKLIIVFKNINIVEIKSIENECKRFLNDINNIFKEGYELKYYDSFRIIQSIFPNIEKDYDTIDFFSEKLKILINRTTKRLKHRESIIKLLDYLLLECSRINYNQPISNSVVKIESLTKEVEKQQKTVNELLEKSKNTNNQAITIFSIFSAIIMTFAGGIGFTSSALRAMSKVSAYRIVFVITLVGFALFNTIFMLLFVISRIIDKPIGLRCKYMTNNCTVNGNALCGDNKCSVRKKPTFLCKFKQKYPYIFYVDVFLIIIMAADFGLWAFFKPDSEVGMVIKKPLGLLWNWIKLHPFIVLLILISIVLITIVIKFIKKRNQSIDSL